MELNKRWEDMKEKEKIAYFEKKKREKARAEKAEAREKIEKEIEESNKEKSLKKSETERKKLDKLANFFEQNSESFGSEASKKFVNNFVAYAQKKSNQKDKTKEPGTGFFRMEARSTKQSKRIKRGQLTEFIKSKNFTEYQNVQSNGRRFTETTIRKCRAEAIETQSVEVKSKQGARGLVNEALRRSNTAHLPTPSPNHIAIAHGTEEDLLGLEDYLEKWEQDYERRHGKPLDDESHSFIGGVVSAPDTLERHEQISYLDMAVDYLKDKFGNQLVAVVVHDDEHAEDPRSHYHYDAKGNRKVSLEHTDNTDRHLHFHFFVRPEMGKDFDLHPGVTAFKQEWKDFDKVLGERKQQRVEVEIETNREKLAPNKYKQTVVKSVVKYEYQPDGTKLEISRQSALAETKEVEGKWDSRRSHSLVVRIPKSQKDLAHQLLQERRMRANNAYKNAMVREQDEFYQKVSCKFGLTRLGPARYRYAGEDWKEHRKLQETIEFGNNLAEVNHSIAQTAVKKAMEVIENAQAEAEKIKERAIKEAQQEISKMSEKERIAILEKRKALKKLEKAEAEKLKSIEKLQSTQKKAEVALDEIRENVSAIFPTKRKEIHQKIKELDRKENKLEIDELTLNRRESELEKSVINKVNNIGNQVEDLKNRLQTTEAENKTLLSLVQRYAPEQAKKLKNERVIK